MDLEGVSRPNLHVGVRTVLSFKRAGKEGFAVCTCLVYVRHSYRCWSVVHLYRCTLVETYTQEPVSASLFVVCTHNLSSVLSIVGDRRRGVIDLCTFLYIKYAPPFSHYLLNTVHRLTSLVIVDFHWALYITQWSEVWSRNSCVYISLISQTLCCWLGLLMYIDGGGKPDCCWIAGCTWPLLLYSPGFPRLQGFVCGPKKFETGELKPPLYCAHPLWTCSNERAEKLDHSLQKYCSWGKHGETRRRSCHPYGWWS